MLGECSQHLPRGGRAGGGEGENASFFLLWSPGIVHFIQMNTYVKVIVDVQGEPVFSVMEAGWFCEKSG
jgi:hypothetical protein